jgi:hypothetical protein
VNTTPETDTLRKRFKARIQEYEKQSKTWLLLQKFPREILDDLLRYQRAVLKEGLDTDNKYWLVFLPTSILAHQVATRMKEVTPLLQESLRWALFLKSKQAMESS